MLCCECGIMRKDRDNPLALSPKKACQGQTDYGRELEQLRADLEAEKSRTLRARRHLWVEIRHLREEAERKQQRALRELTARRGSQKDWHSNRPWRLLSKEVNIKDSGYSNTDSTGKEACLISGDTFTKLEQLLLTLYDKINGEQGVYKVHHRQDLELEKAVFLCHLLEALERQGRQSAGHLRYISKSPSRKPTQERSSFSQTRSHLTYSRASLQRSQSASLSAKKTTKQVRLKQFLSEDSAAADPCTTAAVVDTCWSSSLNICHPANIPHAGWDDQPPCCTESSGSDESLSSKCMDTNMEVSNFIFPTLISDFFFTGNLENTLMQNEWKYSLLHLFLEVCYENLNGL